MFDDDASSVQAVLAAIERSMHPGAALVTPSRPTVARRLAQRNIDSNLTALAIHQPGLVDLLNKFDVPPMTFQLGRDGALTCRDVEGKWWGGSALPLHLGRWLLRKMEPQGGVICLLSPSTAGQIVAAIEHLAAAQALIAIIPDEQNALLALHCHDFSEDFRQGRLWLVCGASWEQSLSDLLVQNPGLCIPQQYVRTSLLDEGTLQSMTAAGNRVFAFETQRRSALIEQMRSPATVNVRAGGKPARICLVCGSSFSLWNIAPMLLPQLLKQPPTQWNRLDIEQTLSASPLALALAARECDAVVASDLFRNDLPGVVSCHIPWITWATTSRVAQPDPSAARDVLLLADRAWQGAALRQGWTNNRISFASWPLLFDFASKNIPGNGAIAMIADAVLDPKPARLNEFSSHGVLWESIGKELLANPLALEADLDAYLTARMRTLEIAGDHLDRAFFRNHLILPAWRIGVARLLIESGLPLVLFGKGWGDLPDLAKHVGIPVQTLGDLGHIARTVSAVLCPMPSRHAHPVEMLGRPVVYITKQRESTVREARLAVSRAAIHRPITGISLSSNLILSLLSPLI